MILHLDLHTHTNLYSACSILAPEALCQTALERGLNALAITEHHYQWSAREIARLQETFPALKLYAGVEISCTDGFDYVVFGLQAGLYHPHPMPFEQLRTLLDASASSFIFVAHPFRHNEMEGPLAERILDGIEMGSYNLLNRASPAGGPVEIVRASLRDAWRDKMGWIGLCNSDGHSRRMLGTFYNQIETHNGLPPDEDALIALLRHAEIRCVRNEAQIRAAAEGRASL